MKKILKNRVFQIVFILLIVLLLVLLCFFNRVDEDVVTRVSKVLGYKYYNIECLNDKCNYVVAYSGDKNGKTTVKVINSNGKTVGKYKATYSKTTELRKKPISVTKKYMILSYQEENDSTGHKYEIVDSNGKKILEGNNSYVSITDELFYEENNDLYTIYDYKGNILVKDVSDLNFYNNKKIITFVSDELNIIDENSKRILDDYKIDKEVKNDNETLYLILENKDNTFYYYDVKNNKIVGDSFTNYAVMSDNKLLVTVKENNETKKYLLNAKGEREKEFLSNQTINDKLTNNINKDIYQIVDDSIVLDNQKGILVKNTEDNSLGTYEIKTGTYSKLFSFKDELPGVSEEKTLNIYTLYESSDDVYLQVGCSTYYCNEENIVVYNPMKNSISFKVSNSEKEIKKYREYTNGYKVLYYTDKTYSLFDKDNKELVSSTNNIDIIDEEILYGSEIEENDLLLYSSKENKLINNEDSLANIDTSSNYKFYKFTKKDNLYLYDQKGKLIKKIDIKSSNITVSDKYILYFKNNKAYLINLKNNKTISYDMTTKESVMDEEGLIIKPYKGSIIVSNFETKNIKVVNYNKKIIKNIKNSEVSEVGFDEKNNKIFLITKQDGNYGLYIIK